MTGDDPSIEELLQRAAAGDPDAQGALLRRERARLRRMITLRIDKRLLARVDPSDVLQETLIEAANKLSDYVRHQPLPFYPWLRQIAAERLEKLKRRHVTAQKRSVKREVHENEAAGDRSAAFLIQYLVASQTSPSGQLQQQERRRQIGAALQDLAADDRDILVLRHLEQLSIGETAAVLGISEAAAKSRHFRAIQRFRLIFTQELGAD